MDATITVRNLGPICEAVVPIRRINLFIGSQASGKSTIAKVISQCLWAEKNHITTGEESDIYEGLRYFHMMDEAYFASDKVEVLYQGPHSRIRMVREKGRRYPQVTYERLEGNALYQNVKIGYVPAMRNFVASIPNLHKYNEQYNSLMDFLGAWDNAKRHYQRKRSFLLDLPDCHFSYRYREGSNQDLLVLPDKQVLALPSASSGQQSLIPLLLVADHILAKVYEASKVFSLAELGHIKKRAPGLASIVDELGRQSRNARTQELEVALGNLWEELGYCGEYGFSHLIVEEPEQNLYPSTQGGLVRHLVALTRQKTPALPHSLTITTHSPYILYSLDNCMLAGIVRREKGDDALRELGQDVLASAIDPQEVGLWIVRKGGVQSLQEGQRGLLSHNAFNEEFQAIHERMFQLSRKLR